MAKPVSQSRTEWVPKGTMVNGKAVAKGYLAQKGKPAKKVTAKVQMETQTMGVARGDVQAYSKGRRKTEMMGAGKKKAVSSNAAPRKRAATGPSAGTNPTPRTNPQADMGAARTNMKSYTPSAGGKLSKASAKAGAVSRIENNMARKAKIREASRTAAGTPNTGAKKYQTPGPDLGAAFAAWKAKPAITAKDRERAAAKAKLEKAARQKAINLIKSKGGKR